MRIKISQAYQYLTQKKPDGDCLITMSLMVEGAEKAIRVKQGMLEQAMQHGGLIVTNANNQKVRVPLTDENVIRMSINGLQLITPLAENKKPVQEAQTKSITEAKHPDQKGGIFEFEAGGKEVNDFIDKYDLSGDIAEQTNEGQPDDTIVYALTPTASKEIIKAYDTFMEKNIGMDSDAIESMQAEVDGHIKEMLEKLDYKDNDITAEVIEDKNKTSGDLAYMITLKKGKEEQDWEPIGYYYDQKTDNRLTDAAQSWNWAAWLGVPESPLYDEAWAAAYLDVDALATLFLVDQDVDDLEDILTEWVNPTSDEQGPEAFPKHGPEIPVGDEQIGEAFRKQTKQLNEDMNIEVHTLANEGDDTNYTEKITNELQKIHKKIGQERLEQGIYRHLEDIASKLGASLEIKGGMRGEKAIFNFSNTKLRKGFDPSEEFGKSKKEAFRSQAQRRMFYARANKPGGEGHKWKKMVRKFEKETPKGAGLPEKVEENTLRKPLHEAYDEWDTGEVSLWFNSDEYMYTHIRAFMREHKKRLLEIGIPNNRIIFLVKARGIRRLRAIWAENKPNRNVNVKRVDWEEVFNDVLGDIFEEETPKGADLPEKMNEANENATPANAKKLTAEKLSELGISYDSLSAKTVGFQDLARGSSVFVTVHGWKPNPAADTLKAFAKSNGFRINFKGTGFVEASSRFPVECLKCGSKFMTSSMAPVCPKCGSTDIDLVEKNAPKTKGTLHEDDLSSSFADTYLEDKQVRQWAMNFGLMDEEDKLTPEILSKLSQLVAQRKRDKGALRRVNFAKMALAQQKKESTLREEKVVEDSLIPPTPSQPTELPDYKDNVFAQLDAYAKKNKNISFSEHLEIAPMSTDETIRHTSPFQTGNYIPRADLRDHFTWFVFVDDVRIATIEFSKAAHMLTTTTNVAPIKSIGADPYAFPMDNPPPSVWGLVDVSAEQATEFIDHLVKTLDSAAKKMLGPEEVPVNPDLHGPESGAPTNSRK